MRSLTEKEWAEKRAQEVADRSRLHLYATCEGGDDNCLRDRIAAALVEARADLLEEVLEVIRDDHRLLDVFGENRKGKRLSRKERLEIHAVLGSVAKQIRGISGEVVKTLIGFLLLIASSCTWTPRNGCIELMYGRAGKNELCYDCRGAIVPGEVVGEYGTPCKEPRP